MRVLVAGDRGYIGAVLVPFLRAAGHEVDGLDLGLYEGCDLGPAAEIGVRAPRDIRDADAGQLAGYDAVVCLAALSNDPLGDLNPAATYSVNLEGTLRLARAARQAGVERFLFASSCSLYGAAGSAAVGEDADLNPVTPYGEAKVTAERELSLLAETASARSTCATPPPRRVAATAADIMVNNLTGRDDDRAGAAGKRRVAWRPLVHVEDISRAFPGRAAGAAGVGADEAFNVGRLADNVQVRDIAEMVRDAVPGSGLSFADGAGPDLRNYRVDFAS
jgi:nucleoside-diphosphate-sugar epimerase